MKEEDRKQAHGLTVGQMRELHYKQIHEPETIPMMFPNNGGDKITDPYFQKDYADYKLPVHEAHCYHVASESRMFSQGGATAERLSNSAIHKMTKEMFAFHEKNGGFKGQIVHILHNPTLPYEIPTPKAEGSNGNGEDGVVYMNKEQLEDLTVTELQEYYSKLTGEEKLLKGKKEDIVQQVLKAVEDKKPAGSAK